MQALLTRLFRRKQILWSTSIYYRAQFNIGHARINLIAYVEIDCKARDRSLKHTVTLHAHEKETYTKKMRTQQVD